MKTIVLTKLQNSQIEENSKTKLQAFQRKIYLKAKQNPKYKFYCLYDKVFRKDVLKEAYRRVKANKGAPGIDRIAFDDLEGKEEEYINEIQEELKRKQYRPNGLREIEIPKENGKKRLLRIPTIKDRIVQMAIKIIIEPIFEADFEENSYGYRPKKSAHQAIAKLDKSLFREIYKTEENRKEIKSADLSDCFNVIPQKELLQLISKRIIDRQLIKVIKMIMKTGIMEKREEEDKEDRGTPQGGVLSPLLANIYLDKLDKYWKKNTTKSKMIRYADDFVIILDKAEEERYNKFLEYIQGELKLKVNKEKTRTESIRQGVKFLGFQIKEKTSKRKKQYLSLEPSKEAIKKIRGKIKDMTKRTNIASTEDTIQRINWVLRGWQQYFDNISMGKTRNEVKNYVELRVMKFISKRKKKRKITWKLFEKGELYEKYGLHKMENLGRKFT